MSEVFGQVLFDLVAWAIARVLDSESALREANARFAADVAAHACGRRHYSDRADSPAVAWVCVTAPRPRSMPMSMG